MKNFESKIAELYKEIWNEKKELDPDVMGEDTELNDLEVMENELSSLHSSLLSYHRKKSKNYYQSNLQLK